MTQPPHSILEPLLYTIETVTIDIWKAHPRLTDKDVEWVYGQYRDYFRKLAQGSEPPEPSSTAVHREALLNALWEGLLLREDLGADEDLIDNPDFAPAGRPMGSLEQVYVMAFGRLLKSVTFWRKTIGKRGYLEFIDEQVPR